MRSLTPYLLKYRKRLLYGFLFILLTNIIALAQPLILKEAVDSLKGNITWEILSYYSLAIVGVVALEGVFRFLMRQMVIVVSRQVEYDVRNDFFSHLQKMSLRFFHRFSTGDLMARATNDLNAVRELVGPGIMYSVNTLILLTGTLVVMFSLSPMLTLYALIPIPVMAFLVYKFMGRIHDIFKVAQQEYSKITTHVQENVSGIRIVKAYVQEENEKSRFRAFNEPYIERNLQLAKIRAFLWPCMGFLSGIGMMIVLWLGGVKISDGGLTLGVLVAFFTLLNRLTWPIIALGWVINLTQRGIASMGRINEILATPAEIQDTPKTRREIKRIYGEIEFKNVSFRYQDEPILKNINLKIPAGKTLAVVGAIGSGKSTLLNLIPRLLEVTEGEILIDGKPIKEIPLDVLRKHIGLAPQETFLFSDSIAENIRFGAPDSSDTQVSQSADISQILNDVNEFPDGFATMLGERGINLSGGQKQRATISRAVIREPSILLLDDALSSVDTHTEEEILSRLRKTMHDRTTIIVSHRISTIYDADEIIVLKDGQIAQQGTHDQLVVQPGAYVELFKKQQLESELEAL